MPAKTVKKARFKGVVRILSAPEGERYALGLRELLSDLASKGTKFEITISSSLADLQVLSEFTEGDGAVIFVATGDLAASWNQATLGYLMARGLRVLPIAVYGKYLPTHLFATVFESAAALKAGVPSPEAIRHTCTFLWSLSEPGLRKQAQTARKRENLNECKLILIGRGEAGKTSIVKRLTGAGFNGDESKTQGINITNWTLPVGQDRIRLNIWDFGGQEIMHATHQFFLTEQSIYLLVLNGREGGEDLDVEYWLKHIESFGGRSPVLVVQNKIEQQPFDLNYRGLQARYPQIRDFIKTDCASSRGIADLEQLIKKAISSMPEVRMAFPADWFRVKKRLEAMDKEYVEYQEFIELCAAEGVTSDEDRDTLRVVMHCLGIALNYGRVPGDVENENGAFFRLGNHQPVARQGDDRRNTPWGRIPRS